MWLYPRLPRVVALRLAEERAIMPLDELSEVSGVSHHSIVYSPTGGNRVEQRHLESLQASVRDAAGRAGYPHPPNEKKKREFDASSGELLHTSMNISPAEAAQAGVWDFMSCVMLPEIVRWRFPGAESGTSLERFLGGVRNTFQRVWWRACILRIPDGDRPYELLRQMGEDEVVQIMERPNLAGSPRLARQVSMTFLHIVKTRRDADRMRLMREAQKRLMRLSPFISFDAIDEQILREILEQVFQDAADGIAGQKKSASQKRND